VGRWEDGGMTGRGDRGGELADYSKLLERVLRRFPDLSREELEAMVEAKLRESRMLNRVGALLLVAEELGAFKEKPGEAEQAGFQTYTKIGSLVPGLRDVSVRGVVYAVAGPVEVRGHRIMRMKIGDSTGSIDVTIWDERCQEAASLNLAPGDQVAILHAYTRERVETGGPELHVGRSGMIVRLEREPGAPDPRSFYVDLGEALEAGDGVYDVKATVLDVGKERRIDTRYGEAVVKEVKLVGESGEVRLSIWRDRVEEFKDLKPGETIYLTDVRIEGYTASLTPRSILAMREGASEEALRRLAERRVADLVVKVLDAIEAENISIYISTDGERILRIHYPGRLDVKPGERLLIKDGLREVRRGRVRIMCEEGGVEKTEAGEGIRIPDRRIRLREIRREERIDLSDVIVEGILYTKTQPITVKTRFGEAEKIGFWLKDEDAAIQASAWRRKAMEIAGLREGSRIRLKWVSIRTNIFGEPEIQVENESIIEVLEEPGENRSTSGL